MSSASTSGQSSKQMISIVLAVIGVLFLILGVVYLAVPAHSLPGFIGYIKNGGTGKHNLRMVTSFVIGVVCLAAAWYVRRGKKAGAESSSSTSVDAGAR